MAETWPHSIRPALERHGQTVAEFADEVGVTRAAVYRWIDGSCVPRDNASRSALRALGVDVPANRKSTGRPRKHPRPCDVEANQ